jgi:hypothetical protein
MVYTTHSMTDEQWKLTPISQASEARLYTFSPETKTALRKFRLGTSRAKDPQAVICKQRSIRRTPSPSPSYCPLEREKDAIRAREIKRPTPQEAEDPTSQRIETRRTIVGRRVAKTILLKEKTKSTKRPWKFQRQTMKHTPI